MTSSPTALTGANVRGEMARKGITQTVVAERLGVTQAAVSARLRGITPFDINELVVIAALLDVTVERLLEGVTAA